MRPAQKRNRGGIAPRLLLHSRTVLTLELCLVSRDLLSHRLFRDWLEGNCGFGLLRLTEFRQLLQRNVPGQSNGAQCPDAVPVWVDFPPGKAVSRCLRNCMVIVMPALAKSKNGNPETVGRGIARQEALRAPHVRGGVYKPGGVKTENRSGKNAPHQIRQSSDGKQEN